MKNIKLIVMCILGLFLTACSNLKKKVAPNILILYADDLGWSDIGCYGNKINKTPNLDRLANEGMRFTNAYAPSPICSASRASNITGKSPARLHFEFVATDRRITDKPLLPPIRTLELPLEEITLGEIAQEAGYSTAFFGKWHIARHNQGYLKWSDTHGPLQQGFHEGSDNYGTHPYNEKNREIVDLPKGTFPEDTLVLKSIEFLREKKESGDPFLMFFSSYYVHTPVIPNNSWLIEKYREKMPEASEDTILYAAFVETMDHHFGQILGALDEFGLAENTIVIFSSDNGGHPRYTDNKPLRGNKWNLYEGGCRVPFIVRWPGVVAEDTENSEVIIQWDVMPTVCDIVQQPIPESIDGESLLPILKGETENLIREFVSWHFPYYHPPSFYEGTKPCSAIRKGDYKLIYFYEDDRIELYNLNIDIQEEYDLSLIKPELASSLKNYLFDYLHDVNARFPTTNPEYKNENK